MKTALISVSDKTGIVYFAKELVKNGYEIISTGGTYQKLKDNKIKVTSVSDITGFPEIMDGRVKTLHPKIHGGLLCIREDKNHKKQAKDLGIKMIDMVVVNLYPFEKVAENPDSTLPDLIENIDIGGPTMLRSAAKNYHFVTVVCDPEDYEAVIDEIKLHGDTTQTTRMKLAIKVFAKTSSYDSLITESFINSFSPSFDDNSLEQKGADNLSAKMAKLCRTRLRYGENPHQSASYYSFYDHENFISQLHGKELSYNNYLDIDAALNTIMRFPACTVAILKHTNPCGIAYDKDLSVAYEKAFATDTISPFGGIVVTNSTVTKDFVKTINKVFTE
ncbi:MAG: bifunctional phosphoribosylaminoimidazolecarboxamide formyltransferase/IMP cyclohydrolase, partial [Candidatus Cloacimonetes bacterium]|nr:bifunctional phosphoribosylaminoimidazolecarboxamide formyltransferase/IMP cyclohydrolase [Candidatus Cloacimonadota bacterium]